MGTYSLSDAGRILSVSPGRLGYWKRTQLVRPPVADGESPGFEFPDLVSARAVLSLIEQGVPLRRIRRKLEILREQFPDLERPLSSLRLWAEGSQRMVVAHDDRLLEPEGQLVLNFEPDSEANPNAGLVAAEEVADLRRAAVISVPVDGSSIDWFERGCRLDSDPDTYAEAIDAYQRALILEPGLADAHCNLGAVLYNLGRRVPARRSFERAVEYDAAHLEAHFNLGHLLEEEGEDEAALRHFLAALRVDPLHADLHANLGLLYEKQGLGDKARRHWRRYLQIEPDGPWAEVAKQRDTTD